MAVLCGEARLVGAATTLTLTLTLALDLTLTPTLTLTLNLTLTLPRRTFLVSIDLRSDSTTSG